MCTSYKILSPEGKNNHSLRKTGMSKLKRMETVLPKHYWIFTGTRLGLSRGKLTPSLILVFKAYCLNFQSLILPSLVFKICLLHYQDFILHASIQIDQSLLKLWWKAAFSFAPQELFSRDVGNTLAQTKILQFKRILPSWRWKEGQRDTLSHHSVQMSFHCLPLTSQGKIAKNQFLQNLTRL